MSVLLFALALLSFKCTREDDPQPDPPKVGTTSEVDFYLTTADENSLLKKQNFKLNFGNTTNAFPDIVVDSTAVFQEVDGFGYTLTGGSAYVLSLMDQSARTQLLKEMFSKDSASLGVSYLRLSIGASDLDAEPFSYNDLPVGETDVDLEHFSIEPDKRHLIPVLKEILAISPDIKIMGSPWSPPTWMKTNGSTIGGSLKQEYYSVYARYLIKYIEAMNVEGIHINAITIQNEPLHPGNNPSLLMLATEQKEFIKNHLGPAFKTAGITTKIIIYDHNCDRPDYPISILDDPEAKQYIDGSAFHLYAGDISAMQTVHNAHPDKHLYFTEQWVGKNDNFSGSFMWHIRNVMIGSMRNWSKVALEWNLANDPNYGPHTPGGCSECKGALTIGNGAIVRNPAYYIVGQFSKWVIPGSRRIQSDQTSQLQSVAFLRPDGKKVLVVLNTGSNSQSFNIVFKGKKVTALQPAQSAGTFIW